MSESAPTRRPRECVSVKAVASVNKPLADFYRSVLAKQEAAAAAAAADEAKSNAGSVGGRVVAPQPVKLCIGNTAAPVTGGDGSTTYNWTVYVRPMDDATADLLRSVTFHLHPTFQPQFTTLSKAPFQVHRRGWGTFPVKITIVDATGGRHTLSHDLSFNAERTQSVQSITVVPAAPAEAASAGAGGGAGSGAGAEAARDAKPSTAAKFAKAKSSRAHRRMTGVPLHEMHGSLGKEEWGNPLLVTYCDTDARPGYNTMKAHEYQDDPETLDAKVKVLADLIRRSKRCVAYTGAGISTASGINDYASKSKDSVATGSRSGRVKKKSGLDAEPTFAHYALTALFKAGNLKHWVQQNHDGLPQKAGYPQKDLNEIHGAWFDPSNPVVPMTGTLRTDLCEWMEEEEEAADLVLAMGTSLCGMNADRMVETPSRKAARGVGLGSVIVGLQRTQMDAMCSLRFYCKIDEVMLLLALEMGLRVPIKPYKMNVPNDARPSGCKHTFMVPYDKKGRLVKGDNPKLRPWCLETGAKIQVAAGPGKGFRGTIHRVSNRTSSYIVATPCMREGSKNHGKGQVLYSLGPWWVEAACRGELPMLPIVNV